MLCWAVGRGEPDPHGRPVPLGAAHRGRAGRRPRHPGRRARLPRPRASTTSRSSCAWSATGEDLYPALRRVVDEGRVPDDNRVRYEMLRHFGYFVTESSEHFAEYVPWFIKRDRPDLVERFNIPLDEYLRRCERQLAEWEELRERSRRRRRSTVERSVEYGADIIHACETGEPFRFNGNVPNTADGPPLIDNLPGGLLRRGAVRGLGARHRAAAGRRAAAAARRAHPDERQRAGATVEAALSGRREAVYQAAMLDPHTAAELTLDEIAAARRRAARRARRLDPVHQSEQVMTPLQPRCGSRRSADHRCAQQREGHRQRWRLRSTERVYARRAMLPDHGTASRARGRPRAARIGLGLAALGRPGYINLGHGEDLGGDARSRRCGRAPTRCSTPPGPPASATSTPPAPTAGPRSSSPPGWPRRPTRRRSIVGSKWGYTYTAGWQVEAERHEVKDHCSPHARAASRPRAGRCSATTSTSTRSTRRRSRAACSTTTRVLDELARLRREGVRDRPVG